MALEVSSSFQRACAEAQSGVGTFMLDFLNASDLPWPRVELTKYDVFQRFESLIEKRWICGQDVPSKYDGKRIVKSQRRALTYVLTCQAVTLPAAKLQANAYRICPRVWSILHLPKAHRGGYVATNTPAGSR